MHTNTQIKTFSEVEFFFSLWRSANGFPPLPVFVLSYRLNTDINAHVTTAFWFSPLNLLTIMKPAVVVRSGLFERDWSLARADVLPLSVRRVFPARGRASLPSFTLHLWWLTGCIIDAAPPAHLSLSVCVGVCVCVCVCVGSCMTSCDRSATFLPCLDCADVKSAHRRKPVYIFSHPFILSFRSNAGSLKECLLSFSHALLSPPFLF